MFIPDNFFQVNFKFTGAGLPSGGQVTHGGDRSGFVGATADIAAAVHTAWDTHLKGVTPQAVTLASILVKEGPNDTGPAFELAVGAAGTGETENVNPQSCLLVQKRTDFGGRKGRGRMFYPLTENDIATGGGITSGSLTTFQSAFSSYRGALASADIPMVLLHTTNTPSPYTVTQLAVQAVAATQRRRLRR